MFLFLPVVFCLSRLVPEVRWKNAVLLVFSLFFYAFGEPLYVLLLLFSAFVNFMAGYLLGLPQVKCRRAILGCALAANLLLLSVFKYTDFLLRSLNQLFSFSLPLPGIALPVGISFFTFQGISYLIDVYRDENLASKSFIKLALYISFFPQLIAGPIVKYHDVSQQIDSRETSLQLTAEGIRRFIFGLSKKLLLANTVGKIADMVFTAQPQQLDICSAWLGAFCYCLQIYFDFSGYSDMAIGLGKMFGFHFLENFNYPYISSSIKEFWRRWHISLSTWFRDYLYIPLGGSRKGKLRTELNKSLVFLCTGLWHGASWNFVLWGLWHGFFIILEDLLPRKGKPFQLLGHIITPLVVLLGFVLFRADTLAAAGQIFVKMFAGFSQTPESCGLLRVLLTPLNIVTMLAGLLGSLPIFSRFRATLAQGESPVLEATSYGAAGVLLVLCIFNLAGAAFNPFIYFRF